MAIEKYASTPRISIAVVTKGPVEIAGSNLILYKIIGIIEATVHAINIDEKIDKLTIRPSFIDEVLIDKLKILDLDKIVMNVPKMPKRIP